MPSVFVTDECRTAEHDRGNEIISSRQDSLLDEIENKVDHITDYLGTLSLFIKTKTEEKSPNSFRLSRNNN